jgi:DNA-binding NtrC family response regulator
MNVRELKAVCTRLAVAHPAGGVVRSADLAAVQAGSGEPVAASPDPVAASTTPDRDELSAMLREFGGSVVKLAAFYGKDRKQIYRWLELRRLDPRDFRG